MKTKLSTNMKTIMVAFFSLWMTNSINAQCFQFPNSTPITGNSGHIDALCNGTGGSLSYGLSVLPADPITYLWSTGATTNMISNLTPGTYTVVTTQGANGTPPCSKTSTFTITNTRPPSIDTVCFVTVDSNSTHNIIIWEKPASTANDSFAIYREVTTGVYSKIGTIAHDSMSEFHDYTANPNVTSYKYKMKLVDLCGHESNFCNYHNTINLQSNIGLGGVVNFSWTPYSIESQSNPVSFYTIYRDDNGTGNFQPISSTIPGTNTTYQDVNAASYPNAKYYIEAVWGRSCTPMRSASSATRSNIKSMTVTGISEVTNIDYKVFPNPSNGAVNIVVDNANVSVINSIGVVVYQSKVQGQETVNLTTPGMYLVQIVKGSASVTKRVIIE
jgi:hypothetical protein